MAKMHYNNIHKTDLSTTIKEIWDYRNDYVVKIYRGHKTERIEFTKLLYKLLSQETCIYVLNTVGQIISDYIAYNIEPLVSEHITYDIIRKSKKRS